MQSKRNIRRVRRRAFTLLEVLMVIVILGVLAALVIPQFIGVEDKAKRDATKNQVRSVLTSQLEIFRAHCQRYPTTEEGLAALLVKPDSEDIADKWGGPYLREPAKDGWGTDLNYRAPGEYNETSFDLWSSGPNRQSGDDDDITNWEKT